MNKYIYNFEDPLELPPLEGKFLLGTKGYNLATMTKLGFPVPGGFTITKEVGNRYFKENFDVYGFLEKDLLSQIAKLEMQYSKKFGDPTSPLLLSVRSGAAVSMPGMMDTILNLGLNDEIVKGFAAKTNPAFAYDCYIKFIEIFTNVVLGLNSSILQIAKKELCCSLRDAEKIEDIELALSIIEKYKKLIKAHSLEFPECPHKQLDLAIKAVINSWDSQRAKIYRKLNNVDHNIGTGVTIQVMVFGNFDENSGTGVLFTRNPVNGENEIYGEYLDNAQGEDIVSGKRTPYPICNNENSLEQRMPEQFEELQVLCKKLEEYYGDMQDVEFTIESRKLYILQTRSGKRTIASAVKIAFDMASSLIISKEEALLRLDATKIDPLLHPCLPKNIPEEPIASGLPASPGAATGKIVFTSEAAEIFSKHHDVILFRQETCPKDIQGMAIAKAIVTARGGLTSHAAVVARGMAKPCISGVSNLHIDFANNKAQVGDVVLNEFDEITVDGSTGKIYKGLLQVEQTQISKEFGSILDWADEIKTMNIRANAETIQDTEMALFFKAEGIGLCRTEHMFFEPEKLSLFRQIIISEEGEAQEQALGLIEQLHMQDFLSLFRKLNGKPINIRLLDPPLHEFLPKDENEINTLAGQMGMNYLDINRKLDEMSEINPMLGHRGSRLGITHPAIYEMQVRAIFFAAIAAKSETIPVNIEIMLPLISNIKELLILKDLIQKVAQEIMISKNDVIEYKIGTMIEIPRAALIADVIAKEVDYFSFGTNDLTQTIYGISRDDLANFMPSYINAGIFEQDPFKTIDKEGVGQVIINTMELGRSANKYLKYGVCGEHGGDPESIKFFNDLDMDYVSCSPFRIPAAKIAAAQAAIEAKGDNKSNTSI
ncbi:MAG: pyruvate, phosphate dikinase [Rickettsiaceae bacterium]|nr:pyruvate, phosphate dikinase [Rickettsiaceae bacterium]